MVESKDVGVFMIVLSASIFAFIGLGGLELAGSQTSNILCEIPVVSGTSYCSAEAGPDDRYKLTTEVTIGNSGELGEFRYKTEKSDSFLSFASRPDFNVVGANDVKVDFVLRRDGTVVTSNSKRLGDIEAFSTKKVTFTVSNLKDGQYTAEYIVSSEFCSVLGRFLNDCEAQVFDYEKSVEVPKLPLGEY